MDEQGWPMFRQGPHSTAFNRHADGLSTDKPPQCLWRKRVENIIITIAIADGSLYVIEIPEVYSDWEKQRDVSRHPPPYLYCIDIPTGQGKWALPLGKAYDTPTSLAVHNERIYIGLKRGNVFNPKESKVIVRESANGNKCWQIGTDDNYPIILPASEHLYITSRNRIIAFDAETGNGQWQTETDSNRILTLAFNKSFLYACSPRRIFALNSSDGNVIWFYENGRFRKPIAVTDERVYIYESDGIVAVDAKTGEEQWRYGLERSSSLLAVGENCLFTTRKHPSGGFMRTGIYAIDSRNGQERWRRTVPSCQFMMGDASTLYAFSSDEGICALDPATGLLHWKVLPEQVSQESGDIFTPLTTASKQLNPIAIVNTGLYCGLSTGEIIAFSD